ncbi:MAG: SMC-Scp complex subunit ScpB, partial [Candidatus Palauibacterales bacterium]|nr:SMC-Scp complex subunit ScpB [Candidatus Palauibacterales bacterium]
CCSGRNDTSETSGYIRVKTTRIVEAILFSSESPLAAAEIARASDGLGAQDVEGAIKELQLEYEREERAFQVYPLADGYQILTRPEYAGYLERFDSVSRNYRLSRAALETLAIIAYRQPVSRVEIEEVRGVDTAGVLRNLQEWGLIAVVGRAEGLGRPMLYGTTKKLLDHFGLRTLADLPRPENLQIAKSAEGGNGTAG